MMRGSLVPKLNYRIETWSHRRCLAVGGALLVFMVSFSCAPCWVPVGLDDVVAHASASPVPRIENQDLALTFPAAVRQALAPEMAGSGRPAGLISDFYGWGPTYYVALLTRLHPDRIFLARGAPNIPPDVESLARFVRQWPVGVLILVEGSRFADAIHFDGASMSRFGDVRLNLQPFRQVDWPSPDGGSQRILFYRYELRQS
jgi:hypothetical protein